MPPEWSLSLKIKLTDITVRSIKPNPLARIELSDTERSGLRFRMSPKGNASWLYQKKIKGGTRRGFKLGSYPAMSLAQARSAALEIQIEAESGVDRVLTEEAAKAMLAGWAEGLFDIHFPKRFTSWLKLMRLLPYRLYFALVRRFTGL